YRGPCRYHRGRDRSALMNTRNHSFTVLRTSAWIAAIIISGCAVGPDYKRPAVDVPDTYRRAASDTNTTSEANSVANLGWWEVFKDPQLSAYLSEALTNSWDIKIAAARVLQAEATARITRSQYFPNVNAGGDLVTSRTSEKGPIPIPAGV